MSDLSQFRGGGFPLRVTHLKNGTGTFVPHPLSRWRRETLVSGGGGGGGGSSNGGGQGGTGGQAGGVSQIWVPNDGVSKNYGVGAKGLGGGLGNVGTIGGTTTLGATSVPGGTGGKSVISANIPYSPPFCGEGAAFGEYGRGGDGGNPGGSGQDGTGGYIMVEEF